MAVTAITNTVRDFGFVSGGTSADWSSCEEVIGAVAGKSIFIEKIFVSCATNISITIGEGETTGAVTTEIFGPIVFPTNGSHSTFEFSRPIKLTAGEALTADASGAGSATIMVQGYIE